ncbi:unnamed protein product [Nesidiocoris tenuis]|uniref:Uncharacterized protein n=1 Tax=Nesidiocoris tenuis TaxID=355587 RepID=A0A6H5HL02_9HEMI|nr:unnamed protein product [Nesidiocoris tenuis]
MAWHATADLIGEAALLRSTQPGASLIARRSAWRQHCRTMFSLVAVKWRGTQPGGSQMARHSACTNQARRVRSRCKTVRSPVPSRYWLRTAQRRTRRTNQEMKLPSFLISYVSRRFKVSIVEFKSATFQRRLDHVSAMFHICISAQFRIRVSNRSDQVPRSSCQKPYSTEIARLAVEANGQRRPRFETEDGPQAGIGQEIGPVRRGRSRRFAGESHRLCAGCNAQRE